jgi:uncharacterized protein YndB with AHSA1/START domain
MLIHTKGEARMGKYTGKASITFEAKASKVWEWLTKPELIKQYLYGTDTISEWKIGSPITYRGEWEGKPYEDKGRIIELVPNKLLRTTYWSSFSGLADVPDNYNMVTYDLLESEGRTTLSISVDNNPTQESADHSASNWASVLKTMKTLLEK